VEISYDTHNINQLTVDKFWVLN